MKPALVLLAAGASRRLGECKALVDLGGRTPLTRLLVASAEHTDGIPLVVTGKHDASIRADLEQGPVAVEIATNARWHLGRTGSVRLASERRSGRDLIIAPVDCPLVPKAVFDSLAREWRSAGAPARGWLAPRLAGTANHGHPVVLGRELHPLLAEFGADSPLRGLRDSAHPVFSVEVKSAAILDDLDGPDHLALLRARLVDATDA